MNHYSEDDYLMLSGIQHFVFCKRQWALIHIEQQWQENLHTVEGNILHKKAHDGAASEKRKDLLITRGMRVFSRSLGISGVCDVVEFHQDAQKGISLHGRKGKYSVYPVEYKRGEPKQHDADILQMVAQGICLEEMLSCEIQRGFLYYGEIRRRIEVEFNEELRCRVRDIFAEMHQYYCRRHTPKVKPTKSCNACSLKVLCLPKLYKKKSAKSYISRKISEEFI
jgi:CRISPR-associated exonuclease Cas4